MQKIKPPYRNIILISSYLFLTAVFFYGGYGAGLHRDAKLRTETTPVVSIPSAMPSYGPSRYRVILEDGELRLYHDGGGISRLVSSEQISEESFPSRDIALLKEGVIFETTEAALTLMENFLS